LKKQLADLQHRFRELESEHTTAQRASSAKLTSLTELIRRLEGENDDLRSRPVPPSVLEITRSQVASDLEAQYRETLARLESDLRDRDQRYSALERKHNELLLDLTVGGGTTGAGTAQGAQAGPGPSSTSARAQRETDKYVRDIKGLHGELEDVTARAMASDAAIRSHAAQILEYRTLYTAAQQELSQLAKEVEEVRQIRDLAVAERDEAKELHARELRRSRTRETELRDAREELQQRLQHAELRYRDEQKRADELSLELLAAQDDRDRGHRRAEQLDTRLAEEKRQTEARLFALERDHREKTDTLRADLRAAVTGREAAAAAARDYKSQQEALTQERVAEAVAAAAAKAAALADAVEEWKERCAGAERKREALQEDLGGKVERLQVSLRESESERAAQAAKAAALKEESGRREKEVGELRGRLASGLAEVERAVAKERAANKEWESARQRVASLEGDIEGLRVKLQTAELEGENERRLAGERETTAVRALESARDGWTAERRRFADMTKKMKDTYKARLSRCKGKLEEYRSLAIQAETDRDQLALRVQELETDHDRMLRRQLQWETARVTLSAVAGGGGGGGIGGVAPPLTPGRETEDMYSISSSLGGGVSSAERALEMHEIRRNVHQLTAAIREQKKAVLEEMEEAEESHRV